MRKKFKLTSDQEQLLDILIQAGKVTRNDVPRIEGIMRRSQLPLEHALQDLGYVQERDLILVRAKMQGLRYVDVAKANPDPEIVRLIPEHVSLQLRVLAVQEKGGTVYVASADPSDLNMIDTVRSVIGKKVEFLLASRGEICKKLGEYHDHYKSQRVERLLAEVKDQGSDLANRLGMTVSIESTASEGSTIVKTLNLLLLQALVRRASDIHVTPGARKLLIQYRIDGVLETSQQLPKTMASELVNRIKILSELDIAEHRLPQDGSFHIEVEGRDIDFRVATTPTIHGEKVVMRILDKQATLLGLETLGFPKDQYLRLRQVLRRPNGIILVAGPTGSGKTTTLYAAVQAVHTGNRNITTIEDPVEYQIDGVTQIQVEEEIGLTFSHVLRSVLRQDPDVILVGEIRDKDTTENAIRASLTGHLVLATIHSNDAVSAITRLIDMGTKPFMVASSLRAVVSQRLVRSVCSQCRELVGPDPELIKMLPFEYRDIEQVAMGRGCGQCFNTGYRGRVIISEMMVLDDNIRSHILGGPDRLELHKAALDSGMVPIFSDGIRKVREGLTTLEEVIGATDSGKDESYEQVETDMKVAELNRKAIAKEPSSPAELSSS